MASLSTRLRSLIKSFTDEVIRCWLYWYPVRFLTLQESNLYTLNFIHHGLSYATYSNLMRFTWIIYIYIYVKHSTQCLFSYVNSSLLVHNVHLIAITLSTFLLLGVDEQRPRLQAADRGAGQQRRLRHRSAHIQHWWLQK